MKIPPKYSITPEILEIISKIDANRFFLASQKTTISQYDKIQHSGLLKSSLFSARIEGSEEKKEIYNLLDAIKFIDKDIKTGTEINSNLILKIHKLVLNNVEGFEGYRKKPGAIFNSAGIAVYLSPPAQKINLLIDKLLLYINSGSESFPLVSAFIFHLIFEKIHPFVDGNGRTGRLLVFAVLKSKGYDFGFHVPFEEYLDEHKQDYYYFLDVGLENPEGYLQFMITAFYEETEKIKTEAVANNKKSDWLLSPRQQELLDIIKDHPYITFDSIQRRFMAVPSRTLRYDLKKIKDFGLINKIGNTKGVLYLAEK